MPILKGQIRQKTHRLPRDAYHGEVTVAFTVCVEKKRPLFIDTSVVDLFVRFLISAIKKNDSMALIYCFMPEHVHLILQGTTFSANVWRAIVDFKQQSGFWLGEHRQMYRWQRGFFDHIIRQNEDLSAQIRYISQNPIRRGLVQAWDEYPYTGAHGIHLKDVINGVISL